MLIQSVEIKMFSDKLPKSKDMPLKSIFGQYGHHVLNPSSTFQFSMNMGNMIL